ncbi:ATP/GTP-binding protein [Isoptericola sp. F-RaC21]|uniref:ATP/GTP-binding protein n=1 Tax=Isoptericola sp. F-RaC21 TaxID=3141452 RepID=UPI00315BE66D
MGRNIYTGEQVCADPASWFRAGMISNPSMFLEAIPGIGKTTLVQRMLLGLAGYGLTPMVFGDIRPDYAHTTRALDGQVIRIGGGTGHVNPLDKGVAPELVEKVLAEAARVRAAGGPWERIRELEDAATEIEQDARQRRIERVMTLVRTSRGRAPEDTEYNVVSASLDLLDANGYSPSHVLGDLLEVVRSGHEALMEIVDVDNPQDYRVAVRSLVTTLVGLVKGTRFGDLFAKPTTEPMRLDRAVCFDVSQLRQTGEAREAAGLAVCWSYGTGNIAAAQVAADVGVIPRRLYALVFDELHRVLRAAKGMVEVVDQSTRLNRTDGTALFLITHSVKDLLALPDPDDRAKAEGFVDRVGMFVCGGATGAELSALQEKVPFSASERDLITRWSAPPPRREDGSEGTPPGRGKFLIKIGGASNVPGVPIELTLTSAEQRLRTSGYRWQEAA